MALTVRLNHVSLLVLNKDISAAFYRDVLGLEEIACGANRAHIRWFGIGNGQSVHLIEGDTGTTHFTQTNHFCISTDDLPGTMADLTAKGVRHVDAAGKEGATAVRADGIRSIYVQDPDGFWIEINEDF